VHRYSRICIRPKVLMHVLNAVAVPSPGVHNARGILATLRTKGCDGVEEIAQARQRYMGGAILRSCNTLTFTSSSPAVCRTAGGLSRHSRLTRSYMSFLKADGYASDDVAVTSMHTIVTCESIIVALHERQSHVSFKHQSVFRIYSEILA
jgi:hypothetical protein